MEKRELGVPRFLSKCDRFKRRLQVTFVPGPDVWCRELGCHLPRADGLVLVEVADNARPFIQATLMGVTDDGGVVYMNMAAEPDGRNHHSDPLNGGRSRITFSWPQVQA